MALGKQTGQYSGKLTSLTLGPGPGNAMTGQANIEGTISGERGEGTYALTHHVVMESGAKSGTWTQYGFATMKDGTSLGFRAQGTWEPSGKHKWRLRGSANFSDGRIAA